MISFLKKFTRSQDPESLVEILESAKELLVLPDNDYDWSSWENSEDAIRELDDFISKIKDAQKFDVLSLEVVFAPTGPMQEVSLSSDWSKSFLKLAERFDKAIKPYKRRHL